MKENKTDVVQGLSMSGFGSDTLASENLRNICQDSHYYHHISSVVTG